jgi:hypothetical protein
VQTLPASTPIRCEPFIIDIPFLEARHIRVSVDSSANPNQAPEHGLAKGLLGLVKKKMEGSKKKDDDDDEGMRGGIN